MLSGAPCSKGVHKPSAPLTATTLPAPNYYSPATVSNPRYPLFLRFSHSYNMVFQTVLAIILVIHTIESAAAAKNKYCRLNRDPTRCVGTPLMVDDEDLWCPYRMCGPGYVSAPQCPPSEDQATHKCKVTKVDEPVYRCLEGRIHKRTSLPVNCGEGEGRERCTGETSTCACVQISPNKKVLSPILSIQPEC